MPPWLCHYKELKFQHFCERYVIMCSHRFPPPPIYLFVMSMKFMGQWSALQLENGFRVRGCHYMILVNGPPNTVLLAHTDIKTKFTHIYGCWMPQHDLTSSRKLMFLCPLSLEFISLSDDTWTLIHCGSVYYLSIALVYAFSLSIVPYASKRSSEIDTSRSTLVYITWASA